MFNFNKFFKKFLLNFNYNVNFFINFNKFFFFYYNFLINFTNSNLIKIYDYMNLTFLFLNKFHIFKYFKLKKNRISFIKNNFNLFNFLFLKKEFFLKQPYLHIYQSNFCFYNLSNLFLIQKNYKNFHNFFLYKFFSFSFLILNFYKYDKFLFLTKNAVYQHFGFNNKIVFFKKYSIDEMFLNRFIILYENVFDKFDKNHFLLFNKFNITRKIHLSYDGHEEIYNFLFLSLLKNTKNYDSKDFKNFNIKYLKNFNFFKIKIKNNLYRFLLRDLFCLDNNYMYDFNFNNNFNFYNNTSFLYFNFFVMNNNIDDRFFNLNFNNIQSEISEININLTLDNKNMFVYNNHFPLIFNNRLSNFLFYSDKNRLFKLKFLKFYYFYISSFFEFLLKKSFFFKIDTNFYKKYKNFDKVEKIVYNLKNSKYAKIKLSRLFNFGEMVEII